MLTVHDQNDRSRDSNASSRVYIVELKFCSDTQPNKQLAKCKEQHAKLAQELIQAGYDKKNVKVIPILIGMSGTIYKEHTIEALEQLGVSHICAIRSAKKMHQTAIRLLHSIVKNRRRLEHKGGQTGLSQNPMNRTRKNHPRPP